MRIFPGTLVHQSVQFSVYIFQFGLGKYIVDYDIALIVVFIDLVLGEGW